MKILVMGVVSSDLRLEAGFENLSKREEARIVAMDEGLVWPLWRGVGT